MGKHTQIELKPDERTDLEHLIHRGNESARKLSRARILLLSDRSQGQRRSDQAVAEAVWCSQSTVGNIRRRYLAGGLKRALQDKGWPGAKPKLTGEVEARLTMLACSEPPQGYARWSLRLLAERLVELACVEAVSHVSVGEWLKKPSEQKYRTGYSLSPAVLQSSQKLRALVTKPIFLELFVLLCALLSAG